MSFSQFARLYDSFNEDNLYHDWLEFTMIALEKQPQKVLEVACGTGKFASLIQPFVKSITAIDIDEKMLAIARENDPTQSIDFRLGDMLDLSDNDRDYDLVTCFADSLCFLESEAAVKTAIKEMYRCLSRGGVLLFDVWTPYQVLEVFSDFNYFDSHDTAAIMWDCEVDETLLQVTHYLTIFEKTLASNLYERSDFTLTEKTYPLDQYVSWINDLGPESITIYRDFGKAIYQPDRDKGCDRWFMKVVKS